MGGGPMKRNRWKLWALLACVALCAAVLLASRHIIKGSQFAAYYADPSISKTILEKTVETADSVETLFRAELSPAQQAELFSQMENRRFASFSASSFPINSPNRYIVTAFSDGGATVVRLKIYDGAIFVLEYAPGDSPPVYGKYRSLGYDWTLVLDSYANGM